MATCSDDEYEIEPEQKCGGCDDQGCNGHKKEGQAIQQLVTLCKSGKLSEIKKVVEKDGGEPLRQFDSEGHTLVHWAALAGHLDIVKFLVDSGVPINEHSRNEYGPRPIHWGCVNGHIGIIGFFLDRGVPVDITDMNGCTPLIIAAQYGQSLAISYLLQKGANRFHMDVNGDGALHWAAFKGFPEAVFILLNAGLNPKQKDAFGQTPLHSACIKGDIQCAEMLIEQGAIVEDLDSNSKTPRMLALGRRHRELVKLLDKKDASVNFLDWRTYVFGPPGRSRSAALFFVCSTLFWSYPYYFMVVVPLTLELYWNVHLGFWITSILMWIMFVWSKFSDPGYIPSNQEAYDQAVKLIGNPAAWTDYQDLYNPIYNMCHTCKTVRPPRSKHCRQCNKCVHEFDHHCPWIDNCVGKKNRVPFTVFLIVLTGTGMFGAFFIYMVYKLRGCDFFWYVGMCFFGFATIQVLWMLETQIVTMVKNMTINERSNKSRYRHFKAPDGTFRNPFNRGILRNTLEFWNIAEPSYSRRPVSAV